MKILSSPVIYFSQNLSKIKTEKNVSPSKEIQKTATTSVPIDTLKAYYLDLPKSFKYQPISSLKPNYKPLNCDYSNIDEFSQLFSEKINSQLMIITEKDIEKLVNSIKKETKADDKTIKKVLYELTRFSGYNSLLQIDAMAWKNKIMTFMLIGDSMESSFHDFSSNAVLNYFCDSKEWINPPWEGETGIILDDFSVSLLEDCKFSKDKTKHSIYKRFKENLKKTPVMNIKGWDIKCSDGKYRSANLFQGTGFLKDIAIDVIKRTQKGENIDDILYSDFNKRLEKLLSDEKENKNLKIIKFEAKNPIEEPSNKDILININQRRITKERIKNFLNYYCAKLPADLTKEQKIETIAKFLDEQTVVYSVDTVCQELKQLYDKIQKQISKNNDKDGKIIYQMNQNKTSHVLMMHMFAKVNGIDYQNIKTRTNFTKKDETNYKAKVILDDISASGETQLEDYIYANMDREKTKKTIQFSYLH